MEQLTANLSTRVRRIKEAGRDYLVAPLTLIVPGVLNGSKGPLFYPPEEVARDYTNWNGVPLVVYHPSVNGHPVSAKHPGVLDKSGIGDVRNARIHKGKLRAEGWFDVTNTKRVDDRVLAYLESGKPIEISTGLFTDNEPAPANATHNGRPYLYVAKNYKPDHLAILPDQVGACSIQDGCGVFAANGGEGSGNFGHAGRPGEIGGSAPGAGGGSLQAIKELGYNIHTESLKGVPEHVVSALHSELQYAKQTFPGIERTINSVTVGKLPDGSPLTTKRDFNTISLVIDVDQLNDKQFTAKVDKAQSSGLLASKGGVQGIIAHEIGHAALLAPFNTQLKWNIHDGIKYIRQNKPTAKQLSRYGTTDKDEAFAEAYSAFRTNPSPNKWQAGFNAAMGGKQTTNQAEQAMLAGAKKQMWQLIGNLFGFTENGGPGSGNFGHAGRPGQVGGSAGAEAYALGHKADEKSSSAKTEAEHQEARTAHLMAASAHETVYSKATDQDTLDEHIKQTVRHTTAAGQHLQQVLKLKKENVAALPKNPKKLNITAAAKALEVKGYKLGKGDTDLKTMTTRYTVTTPSGGTASMTAKEIKGLLYNIQLNGADAMLTGVMTDNGGPGSGNFGHGGRPGQVGGSVPKDATAAAGILSKKALTATKQAGKMTAQAYTAMTMSQIASDVVKEGRLPHSSHMMAAGNHLDAVERHLEFSQQTVDEKALAKQHAAIEAHMLAAGAHYAIAEKADINSDDAKVSYAAEHFTANIPKPQTSVAIVERTEKASVLARGATNYANMGELDRAKAMHDSAANVHDEIAEQAAGYFQEYHNRAAQVHRIVSARFAKRLTENEETMPVNLMIDNGGPGSGNFGHAGRPGEVGGSAGGSSGGPPKAAKAFKSAYTGYDDTIEHSSGYGAHVFEFKSAVEQQKFFETVGGAPHPEGGYRAILAGKPRKSTNNSQGSQVGSPEDTVVTSNQGEPTMATKLNAEQKKAVIDGLITNGCCWTETDRPILNAVSDEGLQKLQAQAEKERQMEAVVNAAREGFGISADVTLNAMPEALKKGKKKADAEEEAEGETCNSEEEWLKKAPESVRNSLSFARQIEERERQSLIQKLTANVDSTKRDGVVNYLKTKSIDELNTMLLLAPAPAAQPARPVFHGAAAPVSNVDQSAADKDDILPLPTINWAEAAKEAK